MKKLLPTIFFIFSSINLFAQTNFNKFSAGGGVGVTFAFADSRKMLAGMAENAVAEFYLTRFTNVGIEMQKGKLKGGEAGSRPFENKYTSFFLNGRVQFGELLSDSQLSALVFKQLKGAYLGTGLGIIKNNITVTSASKEKIIPVSKEVIIPINIGINFHLQDRWGRTRAMLNFNSQTVVSLEDGMDGDPNPASDINDMYSYISVGLRYNFGMLGLDRKRPGRSR